MENKLSLEQFRLGLESYLFRQAYQVTKFEIYAWTDAYVEALWDAGIKYTDYFTLEDFLCIREEAYEKIESIRGLNNE